MNILNFSSSTKFSDVSYETLQEKFSQRMEQVKFMGYNIVLVLINHCVTAGRRRKRSEKGQEDRGEGGKTGEK